MKFLAVLLMIILGRFKPRPKRVSKFAQAAIPQSLLHWLMLALYLIILEVLLLLFFSWEFGIFVLAIELLALYLYLESWSPSELTGKYYKDWCRGDFQGAWLQLAGMMGLRRTDEVTDCQSAHYAICQQYLYLSLTGFFSTLFWFVLLGIPGIFLSLWANWQTQRQTASAAEKFAEIILWLPARLLGFTFFIVGNGVSAYAQLKKNHSRQESMHDRLFRIALAAVGEESFRQYQSGIDCGDEQFRHLAAEEIVHFNKLIRRAAILWLVVLGVLTMLGIESPLY